MISTSDHRHVIRFERNHIDQHIFSSIERLSIDHYPMNTSLLVTSMLNERIIKTRTLSSTSCYERGSITKRNLPPASRSSRLIRHLAIEPSLSRLGSSSSITVTLNSSSFIDYHYRHQGILEYPLRLSLRFRTLGRISNGVIVSLTDRKSSSLIIPYIIIEHSTGKIEVTFLQLDERKVLSSVTVSRPVAAQRLT